MLGSGLLLGAITMVGAGRLLVRVDPLPTAEAPADVIFVLGGSWVDRWLEAVDLYHAGSGRRILVSAGAIDAGQRQLRERGLIVPTTADIARGVMVDQLGLPADRVLTLNESVDNTAAEAEALGRLAAEQGWSSAIIITTRPATRRAGHAFRRVLGDQFRVIVRDTRFDQFDPSWWWRTRASFRQTFYELPKLLAYRLGLGA